MDHGSGTQSGVGGVNPPQNQTAPLDADRPDLETHFLGLLSDNIDAAGMWIPLLKQGLDRLPPAERGPRERLIACYYEACSSHRPATRWAERALADFRLTHQTEAVHKTLRILFSSAVHMGRYDKARYYAKTSLADPSLGAAERVKIHTNLGSMEMRLDNYVDALHQFTAAQKLLRTEPNPKTEAVVLYNLGTLYLYINKFAEAENHFVPAYELFREQKKTLYQAHALQALGILHTILGQYFHAESKLKEAKELYASAGDHLGSALCDVDLFQMDIRLNHFERALDSVPGLIASFKDLDRHFEMGMIYYRGLQAAVALNEFTLAEDYLEAADALFKTEGNRHYQALCNMWRGVLWWRQGHTAGAHDAIEKARVFFVETGIGELELECVLYLANISGGLNREQFQRVRHLLKSPISPRVRTQAQIAVSNYWHAANQYKRSVRALFEAVNTIEETRASISSQQLRGSFFQDKTEVYELLIERLFQWKNPSARVHLFKVMEMSRGRQISEQLSDLEALPPVLNREDPTIIKLNRLELRLVQLNRKLELSKHVEDAVERGALLAALQETRVEIKALKSRMMDEDRLGAFFPFDLDPHQISELLRADHVLVVYFIGRKWLYRIELDHRGMSIHQTELYDRFDKDLNLMVNIFSNRLTPKMDRAMAFVDRISAMMAPTKRPGVKHYSFVLHKQLQRFPLALMRRDGRFLIESHTISQCPNVPIFYFSLKREASRFQNPVFFFSDAAADPTATERHTLNAGFKSARVYDTLAVPELSNVLSKGDFIHFSGHCHFNRRNPFESYLELRGDRLPLSDFAKFRWEQHPFINLAACSSGLMAMGPGNEPFGFVVSAFATGASNILASLWDIDDTVTGGWMDVFYDHLTDGLSIAYQKACLETMAKYEEPYFWAGFCLMGRP